ncbi:MAG: LysR family transcriptional regulator [Hyphomicrobiaceae bacterium]
MDVQDLRIFARVARIHNLTAVGAEFELSAGTISKRLQALESELCARLFDRTTRAISITAEGEALLEQVELVLEQLDGAIAGISENVANPRGKLRVSAPASLGRGVIAPAACVFMKAYPDIELQIDLTDRVVSLHDGGYDVAIRTGALEDSRLVAKRLAGDPQVIVAAPEYIAQRGRPCRPEDLAQHSCLMLGDGQQWRLHKRGKVFDIKVTGQLRSDNGELLRHAAIEGLGILRVAQSRVASEIERGLLVPLLSDYDAGNDAAIWAIYPSSRHILPKLRVFLDFMAAWLRDPAVSSLAAAEGQVAPEIEEVLRRLAGRRSVAAGGRRGRP